MSGRYAAASVSCPVACTVNARWVPYSVPVGRFTFACAIARSTSSIPIPRDAKALGSTWTRTANFWAPKTSTWATPLTVEIRWASRVSAYSSTW